MFSGECFLVTAIHTYEKYHRNCYHGYKKPKLGHRREMDIRFDFRGSLRKENNNCECE